MTSTGFRELTDADVDEALEGVIFPQLLTLLAARRPGHCVRVTDVPAALAARLCSRLRGAAGPSAQVHVLGAPPLVPAELAISSTKLVELRNPRADGELRPPLLVFIPPGTHASAEDSFGVATFEQADLGDVYRDLVDRLHTAVPTDLRSGIDEVLDVVSGDAVEPGAPSADSLAQARYLLTVHLNDHNPDVAGAAVFELGLVPDFELFRDLAMVRTRAARNARHMRILTRADNAVRQRVVGLRLTDPGFRARLAAFLVACDLDDRREWTRRIVVDPANWGFSFHRWPLPDDVAVQPVHITVAEVDLPYAGDQPSHSDHPILSTIIGQRYLAGNSGGSAQLTASFTVDPDPRVGAGLTSFRVVLVAEESGPTGVRAVVKVSSTAKRSYRVKLSKIRQSHLDSGWHFLRIEPLDANGVPVPVMQYPDGVDPAASADHPDNESARFFVLGGDDELDESPPRARVPRGIGVSQELLRLRFGARRDGRDWEAVECRHVAWKDPGRTVEAAFGAHGTVEIPMSPVLVQLERAILSAPEQLRPYELDITAHEPARIRSAPEEISEESRAGAGSSEALEAFLRARARVFEAVRGTEDLVLAGRDIEALRESALTYAEAYASLVGTVLRQAEHDGVDPRGRLAYLMRVDTAVLHHADAKGRARRLVLVSPTHPLRLLWLVTWSALGRHWLSDGDHGREDDVAVAERTVSALEPAGFPFAVPAADGTLAIAAADLTPYWAVHLPTNTEDPHTLLGEVAAALGLPDRSGTSSTVTAAALADRLERYVRMHPYVRSLIVCAVNPGRGQLLANTLLALQRRPDLRHLTYDMRLFSADARVPETGEALAELLAGQWSTALEAEVFATATLAGEPPKLSVSVRPLADITSATSDHHAHVTILFDGFSGEKVEVAAPSEPAPPPVHGLVQHTVVDYDENDGVPVWVKRPRHGLARGLPGAEECSDLLSRLPAILSAAAAAVTTGEAGTGQVPQLRLALTPADGALLHQAHQSSDWVITVDRTLGIEYFDNPRSSRRSAYIIDVAPETVSGLTHHLMVSSRSVDELQALLTPVTEQHGLHIESRHIRTFFDQLRLLSGRLAFKIASAAPNQRTEVLGLSLARLYLQYQDVLADQILVPLDAHLELYRDARQRVDEVAESVSLRRTDLALFSLDAVRRTITCRLVEVKCASALAGAGDLQKLRETVVAQLESTAAVLVDSFDPAAHNLDRLDRVVRNAELASLLGFYLSRAHRHGMMTAQAMREGQALLDHLDWGYRLELTRTGLIFDLGAPGTEQFTDEGVEFHRIGRDMVEQLLDAIPTDLPAVGDDRAFADTAAALVRANLGVPRLPDAAFRAPRRMHEVPDFSPVEAEPPSRPDDVGAEVAEDDHSAENSVPEPDSVPVTGDETPPRPSRGSQVTSADLAWTPEIYLGVSGETPQYGVLGECSGRKIALDLNETHTISLFGVQGGGKSYTLGSIIEAVTLPAPPVNVLPSPLATIVFHYSPTADYAPEFTSMTAPNPDDRQVEDLRQRYGVEPEALDDVVMLVPEDQIDLRRAEYPDIEVRPLKFGSRDLRIEHWRFLMGAVGNQATYIRQLNRIVRANRRDLTVAAIRQGIDQSSMADHIKQLARDRLDLASDYIDDSVRITDLVHPGRVVIVDLRDELIAKDEALGLFVVLMQMFAEATSNGSRFNKLVVFDEAHKYIDSPDLVAGLVESVREMRHKGMSILVASQDPPSVPISLIELSNHVILHKFNSPAWLKHLQKANAALADLSPGKMTALRPGEAYVWSSKASDDTFTRAAVKVRLRPRLTQHGGSTRTAVE